MPTNLFGPDPRTLGLAPRRKTLLEQLEEALTQNAKTSATPMVQPTSNMSPGGLRIEQPRMSDMLNRRSRQGGRRP